MEVKSLKEIAAQLDFLPENTPPNFGIFQYGGGSDEMLYKGE